MTHVLIVEDHEENRNLLKLLLEANGYRVTAAGDGMKALDAARRDRPDVVVSDVLMPNMDGFALCRAWMQDEGLKAVPFIFYSATYVRPIDELFAEALGAVRYLIKPLEAAVFLAELQAVLQQWAGQAAPVQHAPLDDATTHALHESALARKIEDKIAQLEAANRKLQESEARFRSLSGMSSDFYWESDAEHRLTLRISAGKESSTVSAFVHGTQIGQRRWDTPYLSPDEAGWKAHRALLDAHQPFREFELSRLGIDGREHFVSISGDPVFDASAAFQGYRGVGKDITERVRHIDDLRRLRAAMDVTADSIYLTDPVTMRFVEVNTAACRRLGYTREQLLEMGPQDVLEADMEQLRRLYDEVIAAGERGTSVEMHYLASDGRRGWTELHRRALRFGSGWLIVTLGRDITERKRVEQDAADALAYNRLLIEVSPVGVITYKATGAAISANEAAAKIVGATVEQLKAQDFRKIESWQKSGLLNVAEQALATNSVVEKEVYVGSTTYGKEVWFTSRFVPFTYNSERHLLGLFSDISERKQAERALEQESYRNQQFLRHASDGVHILDADGNVLEVNDSFCEMLGYSRTELIGANESLWDAQLSPQELKQRLAERFATEGRTVLETRHRRRDGKVFDVEISGQVLELDGKPVLFNAARDTTERIRSKQQLVEAEAQFRGLVEQPITGIYIIQDNRFTYVNPRYAEIFGYGSADEMIGREVLSTVAQVDRDMVLEKMRLRLEDNMTTVSFDFTALRKDGTMIEVGVHGARAVHNGRPAIIGLMQDISEKKRAEQQIQRYIGELENAFMSTVQVATTLGEMRDPYTAGHQRRVAEVAVAIGAELGFDARGQEGLRVAGYLHDIGKIRIPSEILSKPGKLSSIELRLVQGHARASYEVLKDVKFPWPVAEVALQHHERMDGSGYPQGLKGEAILIEARIMAVADVIEAMSSHRPYRAGLGIEAALAEIERGRCSSYDADVADACLKLFRQKGYAIPA